MATYYTYITDECRREAEKHGFANDVQNLAHKLEKEQNTRGLKYQRPYLKKCMGKQGRLLIQEYWKGDDVLLCLAQFLIRGNQDYKVFCRNSKNYYENHQIPEGDIEGFLEKGKNGNNQIPVLPRKKLSDEESEYLQSLGCYHGIDDSVIMESYDWLDRISQQDWAKENLARYYDLLEYIIDNKDHAKDETIIDHKKNKEIKILYKYFKEYNLIFLISPLDPKTPSDESDLREYYENALTAPPTDREEIVRKSARAYPEIIAYDEALWIKVQKSTEGNLALSPEEESILESILTPNKENPKYPLFINGRPGSGKSTILQYLFSEHLSHYIRTEMDDPPPLYLTYSAPLLEQARSSVKDILECGSEKLQDDTTIPLSDELGEKSFRHFHVFLYDQLPDDMKENFPIESYIDFGKFSELWDKKRKSHPKIQVRSINPELAWHTIRTFIKGMQHESGEEIDPDFYKELPRDSKSVSDETFELIYKNVWQGWYQRFCSEEGQWDDQDLAHSVLEHSSDKLSVYPAVFCDEAQDFTNIELELIERLSVYSDRELPGFLAKHVPFGFAGDPFQTLNPTGFNWNAVQSSFYEKIVRQLDGSGAAGLNFNFQELRFNYRSSKEIVKLVNLIQILRAVLLNHKGLLPQQSWASQSTASPRWFRTDDAACLSKIREQTELVIIIPCQENGEHEYVKQDDFLSSIALQGEEISRNILSPAKAKGLEYDRVLLYGFGTEATTRTPELLEFINTLGNDQPLQDEHRLLMEYYLNQFYVAASRARRRLFIVDSNEAINNFWAFAEPQKQQELLRRYNDSQWRINDLGGILQGDDASWSDDRDEPLELARTWKKQGEAQRDPYLLNLAKSNFELARRPEEAKRCEAMMYQFKGKFIKAGDLFKELGQSVDACHCYWADWAGEGLEPVVNLVETFPEIADDPRFLAANTITRDNNDTKQIDDLLTALETIEPVPFPKGSDQSPAWRQFFDKFIVKVIKAIKDSDQGHSKWAHSVEHIVRVIKRLGISIKAYPELGELYYLVDKAEEAVEHWKRSTDRKQEEPEWFLKAQAKMNPWPNNILYLFRLKDYDSIVQIWESSDNVKFKEDHIKLILNSAISVNNISAIRKLLLLYTCNDDKIIQKIVQQKLPDDIISIAVVKWLESHSKWSQIVDFVTDGKFPNELISKQSEAMKVKRDQVIIVSETVRVLARSERLADEKSKSQQIISECLKRYLIIGNETSPEQKSLIKKIHSFVDVKEVGAAFERAFRLTYAIEYYEQWFKNGHRKNVFPLSIENVNFAKQRWIKCKHKLGKISSERHTEEAEKMEEEWGLPIDNQPEYPDLRPAIALDIPKDIPTPAETTKKGSITSDQENSVQTVSIEGQLVIGDLKLNMVTLTKKQRIIFTKGATEDQVTCGPEKVSSEDVSVELVDDGTSSKTWKVKEWDVFIEIKFSDKDFGLVIRLKTDKDNSIIGFELGYPT